MDWLTQFLPITVIVAVVLFVIKEVTEGVRRWRANARKKKALRVLLARECELNHWTYIVLKEILLGIQKDFKEHNVTDYEIIEVSPGHTRFQELDGDGNLYSGRPLPRVHIDLMNKVMLEVATIDGPLFALLEDAFDEVKEMGHVRDSLIRYVTDDKQHLEAFPEYGLGVLAGIKDALDALYLECPGAELKDARVR